MHITRKRILAISALLLLGGVFFYHIISVKKEHVAQRTHTQTVAAGNV